MSCHHQHSIEAVRSFLEATKGDFKLPFFPSKPVPVRKAFETRSKRVRKPFGNRSKGNFKLSPRTRITRSIGR